MERGKILKLGFLESPFYIESLRKLAKNVAIEKMTKSYPSKGSAGGQLLLTLKTYLEQFRENFQSIQFALYSDRSYFYPNGSASGILGMLNRSQVDICVTTSVMSERIKLVADFTYPYRLNGFTFVSTKPEYKPQIFGIFKTLSLNVWMGILVTFIAVLLLNYAVFRKKYTFQENFFHVLAVLLKHSSVIIPSSFAENLIVYSWVIGAMFLCLAYDSVFLSFLSFPPVSNIKHVSDLAAAVKNGEFHCIAPKVNMEILFWRSNDENLKLLALHLVQNRKGLSDTDIYYKFISAERGKNLAFFADVNYVLNFFGERYFISEDRLFINMPAMMTRKGFCCKNLVDKFVLKMLASGLFFKYYKDAGFLYSMRQFIKNPEKDTIKRVLTFTDVAPAFIILLIGCLISLSAFIIEVTLKCKKKCSCLSKKNKN